MKYLLFLFFLIYSLNSFGQKTYTSVNDIYNAKDIVFYGYDFSHFKLYEAKRFGEKIKKYIPEWIGFVTGMTSELVLQNRLVKEKVIFNYDYTIKLIDTINENNLISLMNYSISPDSIQSYINKYKINENEGIGLVVIVECFNKSEEKSTAYFTFFDISTKKIIISDYFGANKDDGYGLKEHWGMGLNNTFYKYCYQYRKKLKDSLK